MHILPDVESLSHAAAELVLKQSKKAIETNGRFSIVLSGGRTPRRTYQLLAEEHFRSAIEWQKIHVFWGDERCVPPVDERSNERMAREAFLSDVPIPSEQIHPIRCASFPQQAADAYESTLKTYVGNHSSAFDMILLGLGEDGHTASLFPGSGLLNEAKRWVGVARSGREDFERVTLTAPVINRADLVVFLVGGRGKAKILREVTAKESTAEPVPARLIHPSNGELVWLVDKQASGIA